MRQSLTIGSKREKPKKVIEVNVTKKHIFGFFIFLLLFVYLIIKLLVPFFADYDEMYLSCNNGSIEKIEYQKTIYCGQPYTEVLQFFNDKQVEAIENIIKFNGTK